jgi:hypothetical protein
MYRIFATIKYPRKVTKKSLVNPSIIIIIIVILHRHLGFRRACPPWRGHAVGLCQVL